MADRVWSRYKQLQQMAEQWTFTTPASNTDLWRQSLACVVCSICVGFFNLCSADDAADSTRHKSVVKAITQRRNDLSRSRVEFKYWRVNIRGAELGDVADELQAKLRQMELSPSLLAAFPNSAIVEESSATMDIDITSNRIFRWENSRSNATQPAVESLLRENLSEESGEIQVRFGPIRSIYLQNGDESKFLNQDENNLSVFKANTYRMDITPERLDPSFVDWRPSLITGPKVLVSEELSFMPEDAFRWESETKSSRALHWFAMQDGFPLEWRLLDLNGHVKQVGWAAPGPNSSGVDSVRTVHQLVAGEEINDGLLLFVLSVNTWFVGDSLPKVDTTLEFVEAKPQVTIDAAMDTAKPVVTVTDPALENRITRRSKHWFFQISLCVAVGIIMYVIWKQRSIRQSKR